MTVEELKKLELQLIKRGEKDLQALIDAFELARSIKDHSVTESIRRNAARLTKNRMGSTEAILLYNNTLLYDAQFGNFDCFLRYLECNREYNKSFYAPRRRTLLPIVNAFQEVIDGNLDLLTVSQPKRTGKTTLGLMFVLFRAGMNPDGSSICSGAGNDLVKSFYNGCLDVLQKPEESVPRSRCHT